MEMLDLENTGCSADIAIEELELAHEGLTLQVSLSSDGILTISGKKFVVDECFVESDRLGLTVKPSLSLGADKVHDDNSAVPSDGLGIVVFTIARDAGAVAAANDFWFWRQLVVDHEIDRD